MKIGFDINCLIFERAGIGKYTENILKNLLKIDHENEYFLYATFVRHKEARLKKIAETLGRLKSSKVKIKIIPLPARWYELISGTSFPIQKIIHEPLDIFYSPYAAGIPKNGFTKMVVTIHDLVFVRFPEHRGKRLSKYYLKRHKIAVKSVRTIIVPSKSTRDDLVKFLKVPLRKIKVIHEAAEPPLMKAKENYLIGEKITSRLFGNNLKYILSVGTLEPRKNLIKLVEAFSLLPLTIQKEYRLVLVGGKGWNNEVLSQTISNLNLKDKVILTGFVKDAELPYIYNRASVFVYPSLYEGFGLPPLEAMAWGIPVICSNISSLPEITRKAAILVDPCNEQEIAWSIKQILEKPKLAKKLTSRGIIRARQFSWEKAARETLAVFKDL